MMDKTKAAVHIFDSHALTYQQKYMDISRYHKSLDLFANLINAKNPQLLELASGPGNITKYLLSNNPDYNILATDLSPNMIKLAKENNPSAKFQLMDCRKFSQLNQTFDALICGFGLPYISKEDAIKLIEDASKILKPKGVLYLSTMEDDYSKSGFVGPSSGGSETLYTYYHQADYLSAAISKAGFGQIEMERISYPNANNEMITDLILIGKK